MPLGGVVTFGVDRAVFLYQLNVAKHGAQCVPSPADIRTQRDVQAGDGCVHLSPDG